LHEASFHRTKITINALFSTERRTFFGHDGGRDNDGGAKRAAKMAYSLNFGAPDEPSISESGGAPITKNIETMHLSPKEIDKLMLLSLGMIAERRMKKGLKLNYPEAVAYITSTALEEARAGRTVEEVMKSAAGVLRRSDVMEGVADMIDLLQVEAVFTDGSRLVSIHHPIK